MNGKIKVIALVLYVLMTVGAFAQTYNAESDFQVTKSGNAITITGFVGTGAALNVNIPPTIQNAQVTVIGQNAFAGKTNIASITIPNGVTTIGPNAFVNCINLASVTIPSTVNDIMMSAFSNCVRLTSVTFLGTIPSSGFPSTAFIGDLRAKHLAGGSGTYTRNDTTWTLTPVARYNSESDFQVTKTGNAITITRYVGTATVVNIPPTIQNTPVTVIGDNAFYLTNITGVTIPNSVTSIGVTAFSECKSLTSITIPASVTSIGMAAFSGCWELTSVTFQGTIPSSAFSNQYTFDGDLRAKFYATDRNNGTPGTYTTSNGTTWTRR